MKERENLMNEYIREWKNGEYVWGRKSFDKQMKYWRWINDQLDAEDDDVFIGV
jgi:hypothetical protein